MDRSDQQRPHTAPSLVTRRLRLIWALVFALIALCAGTAYYTMKPGHSPQPVSTEALSLMFSPRPQVFVKVKTEGLGSSTVPETIYIFRDGAVSVWDGAASGLTLSTLGLAEGGEVLSMLGGSCFTDAEAVWKPGPGLEVYQAGTLLFALEGSAPVQVSAGSAALSGYGLKDEAGLAVLTPSEALSLDEPEDGDHVLSDPTWHDQFAFLKQHASDPACGGPQMPQEPAPKDDLEGLEPGLYEAAYPMKIRVSPDLDAAQKDSLAEGGQVNIELLERPLENGPVWGRIAPGRWVCLQDEAYHYLMPVSDRDR